MANDSVEQTFAALVEFIANKFLRGEVNVADLIGLDDQEIETIFLMGHYLYNYGKYEAALNVFSVLTLYKPFVSRFCARCGCGEPSTEEVCRGCSCLRYGAYHQYQRCDKLYLPWRVQAKSWAS